MMKDVWKYQRNSKKQIEDQTIQWPNEKGQKWEKCNGRQRTTDN